MKYRHVFIAVGLFLLSFCQTGNASQDANPPTWSELEQECFESHADPGKIRDVISRCRARDIDPRDARDMLDPLLEACRTDLPSDFMISKLEEGLAKGVQCERIAAALRTRLDLMRTTRKLMPSADGETSDDTIIIAGARAMESGIKEDDMRIVFESSETEHPRDMAFILEAGESLRLAGFESEDIPPILVNCMERNLRHVEIRRLIRFATQQRKRGIDAETISESIWGRNRNGSPERYRHGNESETGNGFGPGPGDSHRSRHGKP